MTIRSTFLFALSIMLFASAADAQKETPFEQLRRFINSKAPVKNDSTYSVFFNSFKPGAINYLKPLYEGIGWEDRFKKRSGEKNFYDIFAQSLAKVGDYKMAEVYSIKGYDPLPDDARKFIRQSVAQIKDIQSINAATYVAGRALDAQVLMINEAHDKPVHRAFTYSLLDQLYREGFRYLALEMLNNYGNAPSKELNKMSGFYAEEPVAGELIRRAIALGYTLVPYEDTVLNGHTSTQRDSVQAANIFRVLQKDPSAKIIVHAGYGHIAESKPGDSYIPMALAFKQLSGIDPLTVNQVNFTSGSTWEYGQFFYDELMKKITIDEPVVLLKGRSPYVLIEQQGYDIFVVHPPAVYKNNRPVWLSLNGERREVSVSPQEKNLFMVQAYYEDEFNTHPLEDIVPADQTYITSDYGYYSLYLKPGKYKIVFRDAGYNNLNVREKLVQ